EGRVDSLNQQITDLTGQAKTLQDKLDALKEEISKLGNLQVMYSNSIDFGDYDYSGNPNLMSKLKSPDFNSGIHGSITDVNGMLHFTSDGTGSISMFTRINTPQLASGKTYTMSAKVRFDEGTTGAIDKLRLVYRTSPGEKILLEANSTNITTDDVGKEITIKGTANVNYQITNVERFYMTVSFANFDKINGGFKLYDIKIEEGSTATPYQPNLLVEPYNMCREYPNENIADPKVKFPIESGDYPIYQGYTEEELMIGQTYTITLKGTKPASQTFVAYNHWTARLGELKPVDGLTDVWSLTFTPTNVVAMPKLFRVYQYPQSTVGACQIDWLKIEKGNTRTPNISEYKYRGTGMRDSNNPKDYVWDLAPEYVEDNLATDIKISEITGKANNYTDGKVSKINSQLTASINEVDTTAKGAQTKANANATAIDELDNKIDERINDTATTAFYGAQGEVSNKTKVAEYGVGTGYTTTAVGETHFERQSNGYVKCLKAGKYSISAQIRVQLGGKYASWLYTDLYKDGTSVDNLVSYGVDALQNRFAASGNIVTDLEVNDVLNMRTEIGVANGILQFTSCRTLVLTRLSD
ncbi:TPA: hypothetical protein ACWWG7_002955, partial [Enterococcus faecium]